VSEDYEYETLLSDVAQLPGKARRRTLRLFWKVLRLTGNLPDIGVTENLKYMLHLSNAEAQRVEEEIVFQDLIVGAEWLATLRRNHEELWQDSALISIPGREVLDDVGRSGKPLIFAPIHMGCFAMPFAKIMFDHFRSRRMLILRAREDRPEETLAMRRVSEMGVDMRFLNIHHKQSYFDAVQFAKDGAIIVMFVDLPASYGGAVRVNFFGKPIRLAMGIGSLARLTGATVIPLSVHSTVQGDVVNVGRAFETYEKGPEEKERVATIVRRHIEDSVRDSPEQWHMWSRLHEFLEPGPEEEAA